MLAILSTLVINTLRVLVARMATVIVSLTDFHERRRDSSCDRHLWVTTLEAESITNHPVRCQPQCRPLSAK